MMLSSYFDRFVAQSSGVTRSLVAIGLLWSAQRALGILSFVHIHFLRRSSLQRYITISDDSKKQSWALVTGSSDGIGKGFAEELCSRGINVVLHGRNQEKLEKVKDDLLKQWPAREVRILVLDAGATASDETKLDEVARSVEDINLRILVNNVGGTDGIALLAPLVERSCSDVGLIIDITARFHTEITRVLLPQLIKNSPSLIMNMGSAISEISCPYLEVYSGAKAYIQAWSRSLKVELQAEGDDIEVLHCQVGQVSSGTVLKKTNLFVPRARNFAKSALAKVGCGRDIVWPYWPHEMQSSLIAAIPNSIISRLLITQSKAMLEEERQKRLKSM